MQLPELFYRRVYALLQTSSKFFSSCRFKTCPVLQYIFPGFQHNCQELYRLTVGVGPAAPIPKYMKQVILATNYTETDKRYKNYMNRKC